MKKVITYGTYDMLHYGHIRLLERAKALGDYLIVGVTADDFDKKRGKINTRQSLFERVEAVRNTGLADKIIIEEYEGQKIDDIKNYKVDVFAIGSDWIGKFDYLKNYCEVVYLERTSGISSSQLRQEDKSIRLGYWGDSTTLAKYIKQTDYVNGLVKSGVYSHSKDSLATIINEEENITYFDDKTKFLDNVDAVYLLEKLDNQYNQAKDILLSGKSVLCGDLPCKTIKEFDELCDIAESRNLSFMTSIKTAYAIAYHRLLLLIETGIIGEVVDIKATCTSLTHNRLDDSDWNALCEWGPIAMLPIFQILGTNYKRKSIITEFVDKEKKIDKFTSINFVYNNATATIFVSKNVKSEGTLVISGTKGCIYVPAPWWKTDYFEVHFEDSDDNKKFFFQLDGEGIRNVLLQFYTNIVNAKNDSYVDKNVLRNIIGVIEDYYLEKDVDILNN